MPTTTRRISEFDTPVYQFEDASAETMACELAEHYECLKRLKMAPATNEKKIRFHQAQITEILLVLVIRSEKDEKGI